MRCGISTACFFPQDTLESLKKLADAGVPVVEIFLNTYSELDDAYVARLLDVVQAYGISVSSVHPFTSAMEGFYFASPYKTRLKDGLQLYSRYFEVCRSLHCDKLIFHGDHSYNTRYYSNERYARHFIQLAQAARPFGVTVCHENVAYCRLGRVKNVRELRPMLGSAAAFTLDLKQVRRRHLGVHSMMKAMAGCVKQVHISDYNLRQNCLPPGTGQLDTGAFIESLQKIGYDGDLIIELYSDNFTDISQLLASLRYVQTFL